MMLLGVYVARREGSRAAIFFKPDGVKRRTRIARMSEHERWDLVFVPACIGVSMAAKARTAGAVETCCASGGSRSRCCTSDRVARCSES